MAIPRGRIDQLIDYWDPLVRRAFLEAVANVRDQAHLSQIVLMLERGDLEGALRSVGVDPVLFRPLDRTVSRMFEAGGEFAARSVPVSYSVDGLRSVFHFNVRNPLAESFMSDWAGTRITEIVDDQRQMIRDVLADHLARGDNPRAAALDLVGRVGSKGRREGGMIGLTSSQAEWVRNYRDELLSASPGDALGRKLRDKRFDASVERYAALGEPVPRDLADRMVDSYRNRALMLRAESIGRTESMFVLHEAQHQSLEQAMEIGAIPPEALKFVWRITNDNRVRESHQVMDGQERASGEMFVTGLGNELEYPGDPNGAPEDVVNCRCWVEPVIDFLASAVDGG